MIKYDYFTNFKNKTTIILKPVENKINLLQKR